MLGCFSQRFPDDGEKVEGYIRGFSMVDVEDFLAKIRGTFHVKQFFERIGRNPLKARKKWSIMSAM